LTEKTHETLVPDDKQTRDLPRHGPAGDVRPNENDPDDRTGGGRRQEDVEDRPSVSSVTPEDYPQAEREAAKPD